ncbi:MAG: chaperone NapD [Xanthomonadales bacterium]|nr:chaperone NapD [Xanthomonadales bacterium]
MSALVHIASFVVQHQPAGAAALDQALHGQSMIELVVREGPRSVLLCESADERELIDQIDRLRQLEGVLAVSLVHHHAESAPSLQEEIRHGHAS